MVSHAGRRYLGLDFAKKVFQVHGINQHCQTVLRKQLSRDHVGALFAYLHVPWSA